jgi:hypothetical protein
MGTSSDAVVSAAPVRTKRRETGDISTAWLVLRAGINSEVQAGLL